MDLISRESAKAEMDKLMKVHFDRKVVLGKAKDKIESLPSAFEGMTNGEVIKALFPQIEPRVSGSTVEISNDKFYILASKEFWNSPYQKGGE